MSAPSIKKIVSFNVELQVFLIPPRKDAKSLNFTGSKISDDTDYSECQTMKLKKSVNFFKIVTIFPIPSRDDLKHFTKDLWYEPEDFIRSENSLKAASQPSP